MAHLPRLWRTCAALACAALFFAAPVQAGEIDKYLPDDSEVVVTFNVRQLLDSPLVKKYGLEQARETLNGAEEVSAILKELGFDPFTDLDRIIVAGPGGTEQDRGLLIVHGRYDLGKFAKKGEESAKENPDSLKIHKVKAGGERIVYEVVLPDGMSLFVALADKTTLLASPGKDYVVDGLKKTEAKAKPTLKNRDFQTLLERMDGKQSLSLAAVGSALAKGIPERKVQTELEKIDALGGGVTVGEDVKMEVVLSAKNADAAKELNDTIAKGLNQATGVLSLLAGSTKELAPLAEVVKSVKTSAKDKTVILKGEIGADLIEKAIKGK
jgi:hypothetical protein